MESEINPAPAIAAVLTGGACLAGLIGGYRLADYFDASEDRALGFVGAFVLGVVAVLVVLWFSANAN